jgi:pectate lyase
MMVNKVLFVILFWTFPGLIFSIQNYTGGNNATTANEIQTITKGGQGGKIVKVTNLQSSGEGSFLDAVKMDGPRIIVFEVGGVIDLEKTRIIIDKPFVTIAGQTAPSPGITFIRGGISVTTHDVIIQHIMVRPGDAGEPKKSGWEPDGIATSGGNAYNILIDHCSVTWSVDENISASGPRLEGPENTSHKVTISNCLIAECLSNSTHAKGEHSKGSLIHDNCREITIQRNLFAHNKQRNPYFKTAATGIIANNLIYNPGNAAIHTHWVKSEWEGHPEPPTAKITIMGNVLIPGNDTKIKAFINGDHAELFLRENYIENNPSKIPLTAGTFKETDSPPFQPAGLMDTNKVTEFILAYAGARPADRDPIDQRIIDSVKKKQGRIIDSQNEVGGYPDYAPVYRKLIIPEKNIQEWLDRIAREVEGN